MAQWVRILPMQEAETDMSSVRIRKVPGGESMATNSVFLPGGIYHEQRASWATVHGVEKESDTSEATKSTRNSSPCIPYCLTASTPRLLGRGMITGV